MKGNTKIQQKGLTGSILKWIAIITMLIDHTAVALIQNGIFYTINLNNEQYQKWNFIYWVMRYIGRLGFPIFCFLLVEGFCHTHNVKKYMARLGVFALVSEIPFDLACFRSFFYIYYQNVYFTLFIGLVVLCGLQYFQGKTTKENIIRIVILFTGLIIAELFHTDYGACGILLIVVFYFYREKELMRDLFASVTLLCVSLTEITTFFSFFFFHFYNGQRGKQNKYFFYIFYPAHLLILGILAISVFH